MIFSRSQIMKKYKSLLDLVLILILALLSFIALAPEKIVMPNNLQMLFVTIALALIASFLVLFWRENPRDEREANNQAAASRMAYIVGTIVLIVAMLLQNLDHHPDPTEPVALLAMIATKIIVQRRRDKR